MALPTANLDDRKFEDIVTEARSKIPLYCPKWTDYNLSDPGITLIELFAWMVDLLLYRVNMVPEKNYIKFMDLIGVRLEPPKPAQAEITFRLSAPQRHTITIPRGTEVATVRTESQEAISFTTNQDLPIIVPQLAYSLTTLDDVAFTDCMPSFRKMDKPVSVFKPVPEENNALYLGFSESLSSQTLLLTMDSNIEGIGVDPHDPPLAWEFWNGEQEKWHSLAMERDTTGGLNTRGNVILYVPSAGSMRDIKQRAFGYAAVQLRPARTAPLYRIAQD
jgi:predicted phage baseplate assembly protein